MSHMVINAHQNCQGPVRRLPLALLDQFSNLQLSLKNNNKKNSLDDKHISFTIHIINIYIKKSYFVPPQNHLYAIFTVTTWPPLGVGLSLDVGFDSTQIMQDLLNI